MASQLLTSPATAAVRGHHETAKGALQHFQDEGVHWPDDISLIVIGTPEWAAVLRPSLACIQRPEQAMGIAAATLLLDAIKQQWGARVTTVFVRQGHYAHAAEQTRGYRADLAIDSIGELETALMEL